MILVTSPAVFVAYGTVLDWFGQLATLFDYSSLAGLLFLLIFNWSLTSGVLVGFFSTFMSAFRWLFEHTVLRCCVPFSCFVTALDDHFPGVFSVVGNTFSCCSA